MEKPKKKHEFKLWKEFKAFISKGSALDLAVGMIIGSAFTAIVTALVNGILKPLINWIPISETGDLLTELRPAVIENGVVVREALVLDWGAVISAVITFLLTAIVLFAIIKVINTARDFGKKESTKLQKQLRKGKISAEEAAAAQAKLDEEAAAKEAATAPAPADPTVELLREIRDLLLAQKNADVAAKIEQLSDNSVDAE